jgi:uncharacterized protein
MCRQTGAEDRGPSAYESVEPVPARFRTLEWVRLLGFEVPVATSRRSRLLGLALISRDRAGPGLLLPRCRSVHTFGMRFPLDLIFLDADERVIEIRRDVRPWRFVRSAEARAVLEIPSPD